MIAVRDDRTRVELLWIEKKIERWIRFGRPVEDQILDRRRRRLGFAPDSIFAFVRWASNEYGTIRSALAIARAVAAGDTYSTLPQVDPGAEILLSVRGWPKVRQVLGLIDAIEAGGTDPCDVAPDHWRHMDNRLAAGMQARAYHPDRHRVWLRYRNLRP